MKKALIICAGGMSSSLIAKKTTDLLKKKNIKVELDATSAGHGAELIEKDAFDLYLISPQTKMYYENLKEIADRMNKPVVNIPLQAYVPITIGIEKMATLVEENI